MSEHGGGGLPWDSGQNIISHGGKCLAVLINIRPCLSRNAR